MNIILIGMSGSGKTTIGEYLRSNFSFKVLDTDNKIKERMNMEIEDIFKEYGEEYFRDMETQVLEDYKLIDNYVVATGGGIILREKNREILKSMGKRIFLKGTSETLVRNLKDSQEVRPLLKNPKDLNLDIKQMMEKRKEKYLAAADIVLEIDGKSVEELVNEIVSFINLDR